jgi:hypothetical protein
MSQDCPFELESFSSKVRIVEEKLRVAMEEFEDRRTDPDQNKMMKKVADQILIVDHQVSSVSEEKTKAFVAKRKNFECLWKFLKRMHYY